MWREYRHTLHEQRAFDAKTGSQQVVALRATTSADSFFNTQTIFENRLRTEFFKHLPGICTGLGIIGTFLGLIQGLSAFKVSDDTQQVRESIDALLHGVFEAFWVSATAITLAISITGVEKWLVSSLNRATELIAHRLDGLFEAGASTEYLERLVRASEETASQAKILKDALISDLKELLSDLTRQQIQAASGQSAQLGNQIIAGLQNGLSDPLKTIANAVQQVGQDQGSAVSKLLTDVLAGFSERLQELFNSQATGINRLQQQATDSLVVAVEKLDRMVSSIDSASRTSTEAIAGTVTEAINAMDLQLRAMNERMSGFVQTLEASTANAAQQLGSSTETLSGSIVEFTAATQNLTSALSGTAQTTNALMQSSEAIVSATRSLDSIISDYRSNREAIGSMLVELRTITENVRKEGSLTADILTRIDAAASKLSQAQFQAEEYLDKIGEVLTQTHQEFSDNMRKTLGEANRQFYDQLTKATGLLRTGIQELEATLSLVDNKT